MPSGVGKRRPYKEEKLRWKAVGTMDAIHLASALAVRNSGGLDQLLTHEPDYEQ